MKKDELQKLLSALPKVDKLLEHKKTVRMLSKINKPVLLTIIQEILSGKRDEIIEAQRKKKVIQKAPPLKFFVDELEQRVDALLSDRLVRVVNATGTILHTNLGRAPVSSDMFKKTALISSCYSNLEFDLGDGQRGQRQSHFSELIRLITGAEDAFAVNNNAAAVLLTLNTFCEGKEAIVSRGELIEIGGAFRIPEVMKKSQAILKEVGTTNKTHLKDYALAVSGNTGLLLKVHTSNYKIVGFTKEVTLKELTALGSERGVPVYNDLGSGCLIDLSRFGITKEQTVQEAIKAGVDIVSFSGDKLLGGPQAGIIAGKKEFIDKIRKNPLTRALRLDKMTIHALEHTFKNYLHTIDGGKESGGGIPVLKMLSMKKADTRKRCRMLINALLDVKREHNNRSLSITMEEDFSYVGGGALPLEKIETYVITLKDKTMSCDFVAKKLREHKTPVIARICNDKVIMDVRTLLKDDDKVIIRAIEAILNK